MTLDPAEWAAALHGPLFIPPRPLHRPYQGGDLMRRFRGLDSQGNDHWTDDWLGSDITAGNPDPEGAAQGMTVVTDGNGREARLADLIKAHPEGLLGTDHVHRHGPRLGFLVKLIALGVPAPLHAHPSEGFVRRFELGRHGQAECWIPLETRVPDGEPLRAGIGFKDGVTRADMVAAIDRHSTSDLHELLDETLVEPGETWLIRPGIPHYVGAEVLFIEIQEPSDLSVVPEHWTVGASELEATLGLGWETGLDAFDFQSRQAGGASAVVGARQRPSVVVHADATREVDLIEPEARSLFNVRRLEVATELEVPAGRLSVDIVTAGDGRIEGGWGQHAIRRGQAFVMPAELPHRFKAGSGTLQIHRCLGPGVDSAR